MASIKPFWNNHKELILGAIIFPLIGFLITIVISQIATSGYVWETVGCLLGIILLVTLFSSFIVYLMHSKEQGKKEEGCQRAIEALKHFKPGLQHETLITYQEFKDIEKEVFKDEKIFILSSEFRLDEDADFQKNVIFKNFDKNVKYTYFIPKDKATIDPFKEIVTKWIEKKPKIKENELIKAYQVDPPELVYMTICIYNATENSKNKEVLVKFPSGNYSETDYPFIFRLKKEDKISKDKFYRILTGYQKEENKIKLWD